MRESEDVDKNLAPEVARDLAEVEHMLIRALDLQRRERAAPDAKTVTDEQVERSAVLLEEIVEHLPPDEREDIVLLVKLVRTRLDLKAEQQSAAC